jgi:hypothetical protein
MLDQRFPLCQIGRYSGSTPSRGNWNCFGQRPSAMKWGKHHHLSGTVENTGHSRISTASQDINRPVRSTRRLSGGSVRRTCTEGQSRIQYSSPRESKGELESRRGSKGESLPSTIGNSLGCWPDGSVNSLKSYL